nr:16S rRNA (cytidine(1402)-2'-O)-methyltransferase [Mesobacterium pallidum]
MAPGLYFVATPIGTARDITLRALDVLASAEVIAAEDTRSMRRLMDIHGVKLGDRPLLSYHDRNGPQVRPRLMAELAAGRSVAYASEAGMPLIADPGYALSRDAAEAGHMVTCAPGASAVTTALTLGGLPTDRFLFAGFLPNASGQRKSALSELGTVPATLVLYESPKRVGALLADASGVLGAARPAAVCRELTKRFEEVRRGTLGDLAAQYDGETVKGEVVVLIDRAASDEADESAVKEALVKALENMRVKDASESVATATGWPRRKVYQMALELAGKR